MYNTYPKPFSSTSRIIVLDVLYAVFVVLYLIGDAHHQDNFLKYVKAGPIWIMMLQLYPLKDLHRHIKTIMGALFFGSLGDIFLLWGQNDTYFKLGALSFLIGHIFYATAFVFIAADFIRGRVQLDSVLKMYPLFLVLWLIILIFSFWSISTIVTYLAGASIKYVLDLYATLLVLLVMGGFFFFFTTYYLSRNLMWAGILLMFGSLIFFASDNFLAHGKYNTWYMDKVSASSNTYIVLLTYYIAQFLIGKGTFFLALHLQSEDIGHEINRGKIQISDSIPEEK